MSDEAYYVMELIWGRTHLFKDQMVGKTECLQTVGTHTADMHKSLINQHLYIDNESVHVLDMKIGKNVM
jgi:hypothetical protein